MEGFAELVSIYGPAAFVLVFIAYIVFQVVKSFLDSFHEKKQGEMRIAEQKARDDREDAREARRDERECFRIENENQRYNKLCEGFNHLSETIQRGKIHTVEEQDIDVNINCLIQSELDEITEKGAFRAYYFVFHNGGMDILGRGMLKMSMLLESFKGKSSSVINWQGVPRSMFPTLYSNLNTEGEYYIPDVELISSTDNSTYIALKNSGAKAAIFKAVKKSDGLICGFIGAEYDNTTRDFEEDKKMISQKADRIAGIIIGAQQN